MLILLISLVVCLFICLGSLFLVRPARRRNHHHLYEAAKNPNFTFTEVEVVRDTLKVVWEYIGEGLSGDFQPDDTEDYQHLRFSCYRLVAGEWEQMDDASYCTRLPITTPKRMLRSAAAPILDAIANACYKKTLEQLSWLCLEDFDKPN